MILLKKLKNVFQLLISDYRSLITVYCLLITFSSFGQKPLYLDPKQPIEKRVQDLLSRMTLEEKIGQLNMPCVYTSNWGANPAARRDSCIKYLKGKMVPCMSTPGGFFTLADNALPEGNRAQSEFFNELQKIAVEQTRLKIPLLQTEEGTHGVMCSGKTIFPEGIGMGATWNMPLIQQVYSATGHEARAVGIHQLCTLVIEPNRDPRLGRNEEGFSEDPYMCSLIARSIVRGIQGKDVSAPDKAIAALCHYPGQSQPESAFDHGNMDVSERTFREVFLKPWVTGIKEEGALAIMATHVAINGELTHSSPWLLDDILRKELNFKGVVLSEGGGMSTLVSDRMVKTQQEAGAITIKAGIDIGISHEPAYMCDMIKNVKEGKVEMKYIDRAVGRILAQKFRLGLFEHPYTDPDNAEKGVPYEQYKELARQSAREGIVLLRNENNLLPLKKDLKSIAVIGPNADDVLNQLGDYTSGDQPNAVRTFFDKTVTVLKGIKAKVNSQTQITYVKGCNAFNEHLNGAYHTTTLNEIDKAVEAAKKAEVAIVVVGECNMGDGEMREVASLDLPGLQEDLIKAVQATGTPTIVVLINGRALSIPWEAEHVPAILDAWNCGEQGGNAVADVLFGDYNPSGRLAVTFPRHVGQLPCYYNYSIAKLGAMRRGYTDMSPYPLYEFGYGLSYTNFEYSDFKIAEKTIKQNGKAHVSVTVKNTGKLAGDEVVQLYIRDLITSVYRPVIELKGFTKISLQPGESKTVGFELTSNELMMLDRKMKWVVEPGTFRVMVGRSSKDIKFTGEFDVTN
jgi:beta-glucosidase